MSTNELVSIQELATVTGLSSRTLRHYESIGLLTPAATGSGGVRFYGTVEMERLQAILVMKELGLPLDQIKASLNQPESFSTVLASHLQQLEAKALRINQMILATQKTIKNNTKGHGTPMTEMFEGFDHTQYRNEVEQRWGKQAYANSDKWWRSMNDTERFNWKKAQDELLSDWRQAATQGLEPSSAEAQALAARQEQWLGSIPGTPGYETGQVPASYLLGLAEMYVTDERFAANYGGISGAEFVRETLTIWVAARD